MMTVLENSMKRCPLPLPLREHGLIGDPRRVGQGTLVSKKFDSESVTSVLSEFYIVCGVCLRTDLYMMGEYMVNG